MSVRNQYKASAGNGNFPKRPLFKGDCSQTYKPVENPEPTTARGKRRLQNGNAKAKVSGELLVGLSQRPHVNATHASGVPGAKIKGMHGSSSDYTRFVPLTKAWKKS